MKSGQVVEYTKLSQFKDIKDFNNNFEQWMIDLKCKFSKGEIVALKRLVRFSAKIAGVCYAKIATLVSATQEHDGMGVSRSTFERMLRKAKKLGLVSVINTTNKRNRQAHNVYVFRKYQSAPEVENVTVVEEIVEPSNTNDVPNVENIDVPIKTSNLLETNNKNNNNHLNTSDVKKRSPYIKFVPKSLQHFQAFFGNGIKEIYSRCWLAVKKLKINDYVDQSDIQQIGHVVFNQLKEYKRKGQAQTLEEQCKLAYSISYKQLTDTFDIDAIRQEQYIEENNLPFYNWLDA